MKKITAYFILITVAIITFYDTWVIFKYGNQESISAHILSLGEVSLFFPSLLGFTFGHLTWPKRKSFLFGKKVRPYSYIFFLINGVPAIHDFYSLYFGSGKVLLDINVNPLIPFVLSYILGHFLWPMNPVKWSGRFKK